MNNSKNNIEFKTLPEIHCIGSSIFIPSWTMKFHSDYKHELLHVIKGEIELTYQDGSKYPARSGQTLFNPAGTLHKDVFKSGEELEIFFIMFSWEYADNFFSKVNNDSFKSLTTQTHSEIKRIFDIMRYDTGIREIDRNVANIRLMNILMLIYRDTVYPQNYRKQDKQQLLVEKAKNYINRFYRNPVTLKDVAEYLKVSPSYLSRIFSHKSDFSLVEYLTEVRINEAKKMLIDGRYIITDIAQKTRFLDGNYFCKVFKSKTGCSPSKYK